MDRRVILKSLPRKTPAPGERRGPLTPPPGLLASDAPYPFQAMAEEPPKAMRGEREGDSHDDCVHENVVATNRYKVVCQDCGMNFSPHSDCDYFLVKRLIELTMRVEALELASERKTVKLPSPANDLACKNCGLVSGMDQATGVCSICTPKK